MQMEILGLSAKSKEIGAFHDCFDCCSLNIPGTNHKTHRLQLQVRQQKKRTVCHGAFLNIINAVDNKCNQALTDSIIAVISATEASSPPSKPVIRKAIFPFLSMMNFVGMPDTL